MFEVRDTDKAFDFSRLTFGNTTGIACIKVTRRSTGRNDETIFFILDFCMATSPDKSLEGVFTYYLGSN
jgi:hypothetical protein